jgi:signal transduction histidine kinase/streptogramin lyase
MPTTRRCVIAFATLIPVVTAAQGELAKWHQTSWTGEAGPPAPGEHLMVRSPDGYLWLSAAGCLIRFDGIRFTVIDSNTAPALRTSLPGEFAPSPVDSTGTMWIRGPGGALVTYRDGVFREVLAGGAGGDGVLTQDARSLLWITAGRLHRIRGNALAPPDLPSGVPDTGIFGVARDTGTGLWIGTDTQGLWHVSGTTVRRFGTGRIRPLLQAHDGGLWAIGLGLGLGLWRLDGERWTRMHLDGEADDRLISRSAVETTAGTIWFQTPGSGVMRWHAGRLERFSKADGLSDNRTHDVYADREGAVWVTTDAGLDRLRPSAFIALSRSNDLAFDVGYEIEVDRSGAIWGAAPGSRLLYLLEDGAIRKQTGFISLQRFNVTNGRPFRLLAPARDGGVWVAPVAGGLIHHRQRGRNVFGAEQGLPPARLVRGLAARDGTLWVVDNAGGFGRLRGGRYTPVAIEGDRYPDVRALAEDGLGNTWVWSAARKALVRLDGDSIVARVALDGVAGLAVERGDTLWVATRTALVRVSGTTPTIIPVPSLGALLAAGAQLAITRNHLWLANATGVARLPLQDLRRAAGGDTSALDVHVMDPLDGLPFPRAATPTPHAMRVAGDGRLWISTPNGIYVSEASGEHGGGQPAVAHIEEMVVSGRVVPRAQHDAIPPNPGRVDIRFSAPNLLLPERTLVKYQLEGADERWIDAVPPRVATYTRLRPGHYRFRVRAWNEEGVPGASEASLGFRVLPAWYQSLWFMVLGVMAVAGIGSASGMAWVRRRNRRAGEKLRARFEAVLVERARIARELHDTLLQGFTGVTLHLEGVRGTVAKHSASAADELGAILHTADSTLREAREMVWDMRSPQLADADLMSVLEESGRHFLNGDNVRLRFAVSGTRRRLPPAAETTILRVGREALVNALKHASPRSIDVELTYQPRRVVLQVRDDGCGADPEQLAAATATGHWGIAGMNERASRSNGTLSVVTAPGEGMLVRLTLPAEPIN